MLKLKCSSVSQHMSQHTSEWKHSVSQPGAGIYLNINVLKIGSQASILRNMHLVLDNNYATSNSTTAVAK
jgi:hypothetical protein